MNPETLLERYIKARNEVARLQGEIPALEYHYRKHKAEAEIRFIEEAGGEKQLGSNEAARERQLTVQLDRDGLVWSALNDLLLKKQLLYVVEAELDCIKFEMRLYEASLKKAELDAITYFESH